MPSVVHVIVMEGKGPTDFFITQIFDKVPTHIGRTSVRYEIDLPSEEVVDQPGAVADRTRDEKVMRCYTSRGLR